MLSRGPPAEIGDSLAAWRLFRIALGAEDEEDGPGPPEGGLSYRAGLQPETACRTSYPPASARSCCFNKAARTPNAAKTFSLTGIASKEGLEGLFPHPWRRGRRGNEHSRGKLSLPADNTSQSRAWIIFRRPISWDFRPETRKRFRLRTKELMGK